MKIIKVLDHEVARVTDSESLGFLFCQYEIGEQVEGVCRTIHGYESAAQKRCIFVPMVWLSESRQEQVDREWQGGVKYVVLNGAYTGYVGYLRTRPII